MESNLWSNIWTRIWVRTGKKTLALMLSLLVLIIVFFTMVIVGFALYFIYKHGIFVENVKPFRVAPIVGLIISSAIIGTILTAAISKIPLKPLHHVVNACNKVAEGDFSVRLKYSQINELNSFSKSFNRMTEELGSLEMLRSDFINNFSHEFKTPIVSLRGFAKMLKNPNLSLEEREEYLNIIISESDRLAKLATNVLTLTTLENINIISSKQEFDLSEQIRRSVLMLESKWSDKNLEMLIDLDEITYNGNEDLLSQLWINLIDNAIKFSPNKGKITIKLKSYTDNIEFSVMDNGYGMDQESQNHIFDKFYQCDKSHSTAGNGLGLSIVNKIVKLHDGEITLKSKVGVGTAFTISLPK